MADGWFDTTPDGAWPWDGLPPGPELAAAVSGVDPRTLPGEARVSLLIAREALVGWAQMLSAEAMVSTADAVADAITDADHTPAYRDTHTTSAATMSTACTTHNRTRDAAGWIAEGDGQWRSPLGRIYQTRRHQPLPNHTPPHPTATDSDPPPD